MFNISDKVAKDLDAVIARENFKNFLKYFLAVVTVIGTLITLYKKGVIPIVGEILGSVLSFGTDGKTSIFQPPSMDLYRTEFVVNTNTFFIQTPMEIYQAFRNVRHEILHSPHTMPVLNFGFLLLTSYFLQFVV